MIIHTNDFKNEIKKGARQINGRIYYYANPNLTTENNDILLTENNMQIITEQADFSNKILINDENIFSIDLVKNGQLLQSLAKECDFVSNFELNVGTYITPELGVLVNNSYEYINYGDYIIYSKEYIAEKKLWKYVCYDKMLFSMVKYKPLNVTYPITIDNYIKAIADAINLPFGNYGETYTNSSQIILKDVFENQNITYRDILDKLSEITASNILINKNNELELGYPSETNDTINEEYLSDTSVNFNAFVKPINKITIIDTDVDIKYTAEDTSSIETNGLSEITITDNLLTLNGNETIIANNILNKLNGLTYSLNDINLTGVCYYDYLDLFNIEIEGNLTICLLLNDEIHITTGLKEKIFTKEYENSTQGNIKYETSNISNKAVQFKINQQEGKIESKVSTAEMNSAIEQTAEEINSVVATKVGNNEVISKINQSAEQITINANKISLAGKQINLTSDNIAISSTNFNVLSDGTMSCTNANISGTITSTNANITGGNVALAGTADSYIDLGSGQGTEIFAHYFLSRGSGTIEINNLYSEAEPYISVDNNNETTSIYGSGIYTVYADIDRINAGNIDKGNVWITPTANTPTSVHVNFNKTFTSVPIVVATPESAVIGSTVRGVSVANVTTTGFDLYIYRINNTSTNVNWIAMN